MFLFPFTWDKVFYGWFGIFFFWMIKWKIIVNEWTQSSWDPNRKKIIFFVLVHSVHSISIEHIFCLPILVETPNNGNNNNSNSRNKTKSTILVIFLAKMRWNAKWSEAHSLHTPFLVYSRNKIRTQITYTYTCRWWWWWWWCWYYNIYGVFKVKRKAFCSPNSVYRILYRRIVVVCKVLFSFIPVTF